MVETVLTGCMDQVPRLRKSKTFVIGVICCLFFLLGLPLTCPVSAPVSPYPLPLSSKLLIALRNMSLLASFIALLENIQSNLVISNSLISNNRLSRSENLVPVLTSNYDDR